MAQNLINIKGVPAYLRYLKSGEPLDFHVTDMK